nr:unnamed protein product [Callosobruchus analis]
MANFVFHKEFGCTPFCHWHLLWYFKTHIENIGIQYAQQLLNIFVTHAKKLYGYEFVIYNVHLPYHLSTDVEKYGALDNFAAFPFENYLGK